MIKSILILGICLSLLSCDYINNDKLIRGLKVQLYKDGTCTLELDGNVHNLYFIPANQEKAHDASSICPGCTSIFISCYERTKKIYESRNTLVKLNLFILNEPEKAYSEYEITDRLRGVHYGQYQGFDNIGSATVTIETNELHSEGILGRYLQAYQGRITKVINDGQLLYKLEAKLKKKTNKLE